MVSIEVLHDLFETSIDLLRYPPFGRRDVEMSCVCFADASVAHTSAGVGAQLFHSSTPAPILSSTALCYLPNSLEADFWLGRAQAMELEGRNHVRPILDPVISSRVVHRVRKMAEGCEDP